MQSIKSIVRTLCLEMFELINDVMFSVPLHVFRKMWLSVFVKNGFKNSYGRHVRFHTPWRIELGNDIVVNHHVMLDGRKGIRIGNSVDIGEWTSIWSLQHLTSDMNHGVSGGKVVIDDHVWIAPRCIILPGVHVGKGSVVATGSIVTKNVPPFSLVAGVPAKVIKNLDNRCSYKNDFLMIL